MVHKVEDSSPYHDPFALHLTFLDETDSQDDPGEISQVEDVVRLGGGRQKVGNGLLVHVQRSIHHHAG